MLTATSSRARLATTSEAIEHRAATHAPFRARAVFSSRVRASSSESDTSTVADIVTPESSVAFALRVGGFGQFAGATGDVTGGTAASGASWNACGASWAGSTSVRQEPVEQLVALLLVEIGQRMADVVEEDGDLGPQVGGGVHERAPSSWAGWAGWAVWV